MTEPDEQGQPKASGRYENILRNTLMKRTGKAFQRNIGSAPVPLQNNELNHDDVANQIFDNILQRDHENKLATGSAREALQIEKERAYGDVLDDILFGDELSSEATSREQVTLSEANAIPENLNPYNNVLKKTLNKNLKALVAALESQQAEITEVNPDYSAALDEILGLDEHGLEYSTETSSSLSRTMYHQHLDDILWPSQFDSKEEKVIHPPVNEDRIRFVAAEYLQPLLVPESNGLIAVQRQILDEKYSRYWLREMLANLDLALQELETEFTIWVFMNHLDLIKPLITQEFVERFRIVIEHMLPQRSKNEKLFERTLKNQEQRLVFDKMVNNKFEDVRRILKNYHKQFNKDDAFHLFNFFRMKLPEFLDLNREDLMRILKHRCEDAAKNPLLGSFMAFLFFSDAFTQRFQALQEDKNQYQKSFLIFLRERAEFVGEPEDSLLPITLICMDLYHEKATEFKAAERENLEQALDIMGKLLHYVPETSFDKDSFLDSFSALVEHRVQAQYHVENLALQNLIQEIAQLSYQTDAAAQMRVKHLNAAYERHHQEINDLYHKRRDTLEKLKQTEGPNGEKRSRKQFIQRKVKACQQYLKRKQSKQRKRIQVTYREYEQSVLDQRKETLVSAQEWDNDFERQVMENVFRKANIVLKAINDSKSTVQFNLKLLFNGEPQQELFLSCFDAVGQWLKSLESLNGHPSLDYVHGLIDPYLNGLRLDVGSEPTGLSRQQQIGYIISYLGHVSHIKLLINRQFRQVIFDFQTLYGLAHALYVLNFLHEQPQVGFEEHYRLAMLPAWDCLISHNLLVGKGQYHFVSNPLTLHDYTWQPPLSGFGSAVREESNDPDGFDLIEMDAPKQLEQPKKSRFALPANPEYDDPDHSVARKALPPSDSGKFKKETLKNTSSRRFLPAAEGDVSAAARRIPLSPGKFELYTSPGRRSPVTPSHSNFLIEEDDFYKVLGQTHAGPSPQSQAKQSESVEEASEDHEPSFDLLSFDDDGDMDQGKTQVLHRSEDSVKPSSGVPNKPQSRGAQEKPQKRWLEITPAPEENQNYDQMLDSILNSWDDEDQANSGASANTARRILKGKRRDAEELPDEDTIMYKKTVRRRFDFDD